MHISVFMGPLSVHESSDKRMIDLCLDQARRCADEGFAMVTFGEQHFNNYEPYSNPFMMAARLAPHLGRTWFATTIVPLNFHNPLRVAEDSNIADLLTQGRFLLGVSAGRTVPGDFANFGLDMSQRDEMFASKLDILIAAQRKKAADPPIFVDTPWDKGQVLGRMMPVSWRRGGAQIAVGTNTDTSIDATARRGLPLFLGPCDIETASAKLARHRDGLADAGHSQVVQQDAASKSLVTRLIFVGNTDEEAWANAEALSGSSPMIDRSQDRRSLRELASVDPASLDDGTEKYPRNVAYARAWLTAGSPDTLIKEFAHREAAGIQNFNIRFMAGMADPELVNKEFDLFVREVLPHVGSSLYAELTPDEIDPVHTSATPIPATALAGAARPGAGWEARK